MNFYFLPPLTLVCHLHEMEQSDLLIDEHFVIAGFIAFLGYLP